MVEVKSEKLDGRLRLSNFSSKGGLPRLNGEENERYFWDILWIFAKWSLKKTKLYFGFCFMYGWFIDGILCEKCLFLMHKNREHQPREKERKKNSKLRKNEI